MPGPFIECLVGPVCRRDRHRPARWLPGGCLLLCAILALALSASAQRRKLFSTPTPLPPGSTLIIGFTNGFDEGSDEDLQDGPPLQLGARLRTLGLAGVYIETAEHTQRRAVLKFIESATGRDFRGRCELDGCRELRLILFGQAKGGAAVYRLARDLDRLGLPVALAIQVDNVGPAEEVVPPNVARAANLASSWLLRRPTLIRAQDSAKTQILANLRYDYDQAKWIELSASAGAEKSARAARPLPENAPPVWNRVEDYILEELHRAGIPGAPAPPHSVSPSH